MSTGEKTFVITQHGEAKAILVDLSTYESLQESVALMKILAQSRGSLNGGRVKSLKKAFAGVRRSVRKHRDEEVQRFSRR